VDDRAPAAHPSYTGGALVGAGAGAYTPLFIAGDDRRTDPIRSGLDPGDLRRHDHPFVATSNVFAVPGRALYFLLAGMAERFHLLGYGPPRLMSSAARF
jgi:hypothetical protein